jgi:putative ABC transport system permease protein
MDLREKIVAATNGTQQDPLLVLENPADVAKVDGRALRLELARVPGVTGVTEMSYVPWEMLGVTAVNPTPDPMSPVRRVIMRNVGLDFFSVFGIDVLAGRAFEAADVITGAPPAADAPKLEPKIVIDRAFAAELGYATPAAAVGNAVYLLPSSGFNVKEPVTWRIVGVVENRSFSFQSFQNATSALYQVNAAPQFAVARISRNDVATALDGIDAMWRRLAPNPAINRRFLDDVFNQVYSSLARTNKLFGLLASMAFAISVAGLFGMATLVTARRRPEIAVRKTLGASTAQLLRLLLASFAKPVVLANVVAWPLGYSGASLYLDQFAKPIPVTPLPFVASLALTVAIAWLAVGSQTWRAARLKPADVLRHE